MAEGTVLHTNTGATVAMSATLPATYDAAGYGSTATTYTAIGSIESLGDHGGEKNVATFTALADGVVQKFAGSTNYGQLSLTMGAMPSDAGQDLVETAFASRNRYSLKITYPMRTGESSAEIHYLDVLVTSRVWSGGSADEVRKLSTTFEICRAPVVVAAT
jgi:hypothetical protein